MKIIGLDLSLTNTGWVILQNGNVRAYFTIVTKPRRGIKRLSYIKRELKKVLIVYKPKWAVIEGYAYSPNANMAFSIGELGGIIKRLLYVRGINYLIVAPKTLKKFVTGNGNANKEMMAKAVHSFENCDEEFNTDHEVDAYGLALLGYGAINKIKLEELKQMEAIKTVMKDESKQNYIKEE